MSNSKNNQSNPDQVNQDQANNQQPNGENTSNAASTNLEKENNAKIKQLEEEKNTLQAKLDEIAKEKSDKEAVQAEKDAKINELQAKLDEVNKIGEGNTGSDKPAPELKPLKLKHNDEKYEFPGIEAKNYIVRHSRFEKLSSGKEVEDPGSIRIQIYRPEVYQDLIYENEKTGKKNAFVSIGEKAIVLHDPTK